MRTIEEIRAEYEAVLEAMKAPTRRREEAFQRMGGCRPVPPGQDPPLLRDEDLREFCDADYEVEKQLARLHVLTREWLAAAT